MTPHACDPTVARPKSDPRAHRVLGLLISTDLPVGMRLAEQIVARMDADDTAAGRHGREIEQVVAQMVEKARGGVWHDSRDTDQLYALWLGLPADTPHSVIADHLRGGPDA